MFGVSAPLSSFGVPIIPVPASLDAQKLIDAIRDQTDGVPNHLVFVLDIVSVRFGGYFTPEIKAYIERFPYLQMLTINDCGIKSLQNFPHLPGLIRLDLVFNQITGESLSYIKASRHLQTLMLGANKIEKFQHLQQLRSLKQLLQLDLINNPVSKLAGYRERMFAIFPTISILDTLDKSGKDAYTSSSMALTVSRVPDTLFDKSAPAPVSVPPLPPKAVPITTTLSKTASIKKKTLTPIVKTDSQVSATKPKVDGDLSASKKGKSGKIGKIGKLSSLRTKATHGMIFPAARLKRKLKQSISNIRVSKSSSIYLAAVLQYLTGQLLDIAGSMTKQQKKRRITPSIIKKSLKMDQQLHKLLNGVTIAMDHE